MTFRTRRRTYWILFSVSLASFILAASLAFRLAFRDDLAVFLLERGAYKVHSILGLRIPSPTLSIASALAAGGFSIGIMSFILKTFRKTESSEIFFFAFWLCANSFEFLRLLHLALAVSGGMDSILAFVDKCYMGTRFLGTISLFISGLYASGMRSERHFSILSVAMTISAALAVSLPVNTGIWGQTLVFTVGYARLIQGFTMAAMAITIANCLIAIRTRGERHFLHISGGLAATVFGSFLLLADISPGMALTGLALGIGGSILYIHKLHAFYLWQ